jgi:D-alanyl-D-alanine carboxypeptidase
MSPLRLNGQAYEWFLRERQGEIRHKWRATLVARLHCASVRGQWRIHAVVPSARRGDMAWAMREMHGCFARLRVRCRISVIEHGRARPVPWRALARGPRSAVPVSLIQVQRELALAPRTAAEPMSRVREPRQLAWVGRDAFDRDAWLAPMALRAWQRMRAAAARDGVCLQIVSAFRSQAYQTRLFASKRARGIGVAQILNVNAAPGFSEHHGGCALDLTAPGFRAAETEFERSDAYAWLCAHAQRFGFRLSYPRDNPQGIVYEPWHWCYVGTRALHDA